MLKIYIFVLICLAVMTSLISLERRKYTTNIKIKEGLEYVIGKKKYKLPPIPVKGDAFLLKEDFMIKIRKLYLATYKFLKSKKMNFWVSGGTLLGFVRHKTFMPWDDDVDIHTLSDHRIEMFSKKFREDMTPFGLETLFMIGLSEKRSHYKGGLRFRFKDTKNPVLDIFFVDKGEKVTKKIENWNGVNMEYNPKETWDNGVVFPIQEKMIDNLPIRLPKKPEKMLELQYGKDYDKTIYCSHPPHTVAFDLLDPIWHT